VSDTQRAFSGSVPEFYQRNLVPMIFGPHAHTLASRVTFLTDGSVLELAAGTGAVTRALADALPRAVAITATDLNDAMLDQARLQAGADRVHWQQADAMSLPFPDRTFDAVVCGFGVMFLPDKIAGFSEALRVLKAGGRFVFTAWDGLVHNVLNDTAAKTIAEMFPVDPPKRHLIPFSYCDQALIRTDLEAAGFRDVEIETVRGESRASSAYDAANGFFRGTNGSNEIEARGPGWLEKGIDLTAAALVTRYGDGSLAMPNQALLVTAIRP
jgi:ubiquinone/menaquinone biosynthesis C-methylase UbiE